MHIRQTDIYKNCINPILSTLGYYWVREKMRSKKLKRFLVREDALYRKETIRNINNLPQNMFSPTLSPDDVVISLTSYGKRVSQTLPLTLYTLVNQSVKPGKIVVYLDQENWNEKNIPDILMHFQKVGVEIRFCEDIRSYKKIIPALRDFPDNPIITVDDDIYYNVNMVEWLVNAYKRLPQKSVVGLWACVVRVQNGQYLPYNTWEDCSHNITSKSEYALYTGYGTYYPPHIFDEEVMNSDVFMHLCPTADDIWMWAMEKRLHIPVYITPNARLGLHREINKQYVYFPEENPGSLYYVNELMDNKNDEQLFNLIKYYNLRPNE